MNFPITVKSEYDEETVKAPQPITVVAASMHDADVILSLSDSCRIHHDTSIANHPGNIAYKKLVNLNRDLISSSSSEKRRGDDEIEVAQTSQKLQVFDSVRVAQTIVANIRAMGGRFLECMDEYEDAKKLSDMNWLEVSNEKASDLTNIELNASADLPTQSLKIYEIDPSESALINISPDQTAKLKFPVGCQVLYNIYCAPEYDDVRIGSVKSVSMDLVTKDMLYVIEDDKGKNATDNNRYFREDALAFAPHNQVIIDMKLGEEVHKLQGEVGWCRANVVKKKYSVKVNLEEPNTFRMYHNVSENCIRYHHAAKRLDSQLQLPCKVQVSKDMLEIEEVEVPQNNKKTIGGKEVPISPETLLNDDSSSVPSTSSSSEGSFTSAKPFDEAVDCQDITSGKLTRQSSHATKDSASVTKPHKRKCHNGRDTVAQPRKRTQSNGSRYRQEDNRMKRENKKRGRGTSGCNTCSNANDEHKLRKHNTWTPPKDGAIGYDFRRSKHIKFDK